MRPSSCSNGSIGREFHGEHRMLRFAGLPVIPLDGDLGPRSPEERRERDARSPERRTERPDTLRTSETGEVGRLEQIRAAQAAGMREGMRQTLEFILNGQLRVGQMNIPGLTPQIFFDRTFKPEAHTHPNGKLVATMNVQLFAMAQMDYTLQADGRIVVTDMLAARAPEAGTSARPPERGVRPPRDRGGRERGRKEGREEARKEAAEKEEKAKKDAADKERAAEEAAEKERTELRSSAKELGDKLAGYMNVQLIVENGPDGKKQNNLYFTSQVKETGTDGTEGFRIPDAFRKKIEALEISIQNRGGSNVALVGITKDGMARVKETLGTDADSLKSIERSKVESLYKRLAVLKKFSEDPKYADYKLSGGLKSSVAMVDRLKVALGKDDATTKEYRDLALELRSVESDIAVETKNVQAAARLIDGSEYLQGAVGGVVIRSGLVRLPSVDSSSRSGNIARGVAGFLFPNGSRLVSGLAEKVGASGPSSVYLQFDTTNNTWRWGMSEANASQFPLTMPVSGNGGSKAQEEAARPVFEELQKINQFAVV